jgi:type II secretion system protein N
VNGLTRLLATRVSSSLVKYGIFAATVFLVVVLATFPYMEVVAAFLAPMDLKISYERQAISFPFGTELYNVKLVSASDEQLLLESPEVTVSPAIGWLPFGQFGLKLRANVFGGLIDAAVRQRVQSTLVDFELVSLNLAKVSAEAGIIMRALQGRNLTPTDPPRGILMGTLSSRGWAQINGCDLAIANAKMTLTVRDLRAEVVQGMPPLEFDMVRAQVLVGGRIVTLRNVNARGPEGVLAANGEVYLAKSLGDSVTHLTLVLRPASGRTASFGWFLNLLPHAPGAGPYHVDGPIRFPTVS